MAMKAPVIAGKYTLLRRLGHGGMAEVFLAKQMSEGGFEKLVVLKRILPHLASGPEFVTMFLDEARIAADLRHPNIVTIADVGRVNDTLFMVMEFLHGQDIRKVQRKVAAFAQMIPLAHACQMAIDAAAGLHYAHTKHDLKGRDLQIVHRDVSPQNIIVTFEGSTKIVDFGIAKAAGQNTHTSAGVLKGKYTYMSPEQAQGEVVAQAMGERGHLRRRPATDRVVIERPEPLGHAGVPVDARVHRDAFDVGDNGRSVCFASTSPGEVFVGDQKLVGISQRRGRDGARMQCILYRDWNPAAWASVLSLPTARTTATELSVATVDAAPADIVAALVAALPL